MQRYHKVMAFFSYLAGLVALLAILVDDKKEQAFTYHIWQALLLNVVIAIIATITYTFWLPHHMLTIAVAERGAFFMRVTLIPMASVFILLVVLGILAAKGKRFRIFFLGTLANKIATRRK